MKNPPPLLYVSFDQVPAAKGASTHILANAQALGAHFGSLVLATPGPRDEPVRDLAPGVRQVVLGCPDRDLLGRVFTFRARLHDLLGRQAFDLIHFRSIFEGFAIVRRPRLDAVLLYEVNGLPSIELPYAYPRLRGDTLLQRKLVHQENACLRAASRIITVSDTTAGLLRARGCPAERIEVLRNGVDLALFTYRDPMPVGAGPLRILYSGTLSPWQGVQTLLDALPLVQVRRPVRLSVVGPAPRARRQELKPRIRKRGLSGWVEFLGPRSQAEVAALLHEHHVCVVPLADTERNTRQGCCPLKLLEAMAAGCPAIASDLPAVRELAVPHAHYIPVAPDDPAGLALALWGMAERQEDNLRRCRAGRAHVEGHFPWRCSTSRLVALYEELLAMRPSRPASAVLSAASE